MTSALLTPPRFPGGPLHCDVANLGAFESEKALNDFMSTNCPSTKVGKKWLCDVCGHWHAETDNKKAK